MKKITSALLVGILVMVGFTCLIINFSENVAAVPTAPRNPSASAYNGHNYISWDSPEYYSNFEKYKIYRGTTSGGEAYLDDTTSNYYRDYDITRGQKYYYKISAVDADGEGDLSNETSVTSLYGLSLQGAREIISEPSKVQFIFSLRDGDGHSILWEPEYIQNHAHIFEDGVEIDYSETEFFAHTAESFRMDIVLVLDFTQSMNDANAIPTMVSSAKALINQLSVSHRVGLVEYHDRDIYPAVLHTLTTDKTALIAAIDDFVNNSGYEPSSTRCWDAIDEGMHLFSSETFENVNGLVFLSDGRDTSSSTTTSELKTYARNNAINIYGIGFGNVSAENEDIMEDLSEYTGGFYYSAATIEELEDRFEQISNDLGGQYQISYTTLQGQGSSNVAVKCTIELEDESASHTAYLDLASIDGDQRVGIITIDEPSLSEGTATVFVRAAHIPRNIDEFRFHLDTDYSPQVTLPTKADGGLCYDWTISSEGSNWWTVSSTTPIDFGNFGLLFKIKINNLNVPGLNIPLTFDNSIYPDTDYENDGLQDKRFIYPSNILIGTISPPGAPLNLQAIAGEGQINLTWNAPTSNGGATITSYRVYRGTSAGSETYHATATSLKYTDTGVTGKTTYYYKVKAVNNEGEGSFSNEATATAIDSSTTSTTDSDDDGLLDSWETEYFGNLAQDANDDYDDDGYTNLQESQEDSDPTDDSDYPEEEEADDSGTPGFEFWTIMLATSFAVVVMTLSKRKKR